MRNRLFRQLLGGTCLLVSLSSSAKSGTAPPVPEFFAPEKEAGFSGFRAPLVEFLRARGPHRLNTVCLLGERGSDGSVWAWVLWNEGHRLVLWEGGDASMVLSRRTIDLQKDVAPDEASLQGSTWRVTRAWVNALQARCAAHGTKIELTRQQVLKAPR